MFLKTYSRYLVLETYIYIVTNLLLIAQLTLDSLWHLSTQLVIRQITALWSRDLLKVSSHRRGFPGYC